MLGSVRAGKRSSKRFGFTLIGVSARAIRVDNHYYDKAHMVLQIFLKYGPEGERVIRHIQRYFARPPGVSGL